MKTTITILMLFVCITLVGQTQERKFSLDPKPVPEHIRDSSDIANDYYSEYYQSWIIGTWIKTNKGGVMVDELVPPDTAKMEKCIFSAYSYSPKTIAYLEKVYSFFYEINKIDSAYKYLKKYESRDRRVIKTKAYQDINNAYNKLHNNGN
jgi:hypothetical protein